MHSAVRPTSPMAPMRPLSDAPRRAGRNARRRGRLALGLLCALGLAGCATPPPADDKDAMEEFRQTNDPLEPANRVGYAINDAVDTAVAEPIARGYRAAVPAPVRTGVRNVLNNLNAPIVFVNDTLQGKPRRAGDMLVRFLVNSTVGVAGIFDVAGAAGYKQHGGGAGVTMALWGVGEGMFLYVPLIGPTNARDLSGFGFDVASDPLSWVTGGVLLSAADWARYGFGVVDLREQALDPIDSIKKSALDPYATFRSLARQHRAAEIQAVRDDRRATVPVWFDQPAEPTQ